MAARERSHLVGMDLHRVSPFFHLRSAEGRCWWTRIHPAWNMSAPFQNPIAMAIATSPTRTNGTKEAKQGKRHTLRWSAEDRKRIVDSLNVLLANYQVHYQKLRNYHWNVTGGDFFDIHQNLEEQYGEAQENIDLTAERVH